MSATGKDFPSEATIADERTPSRVGRMTRGVGGLPRVYWIIPLGVALLIGVSGVVGYRVIRQSFREDLRSELETLLNADVEALRTWIDSQCRMAEVIAARSGVAAQAGRVLAISGGAAAEALRTAEPQARLGELLEADMGRLGFEGFALIDPSGRIVASSDLAAIGSRIPPTQTGLLRGVLDGKPRLIPPYALDRRDPAARAPAAVLLIAAPLSAGGAEAVAVLAFQVPIARDFSRILTIARLGETGETYAFDREGRMLSESRFEDQLRGAGLLVPGQKSTLNIEIRDPGGNALEGHRSKLSVRDRPLTKMAAAAVDGRKGIDVDGYRDYRGVPVVGAWSWFPDLDFAVATEVDVAEAYRPLHLLNVAFWTLFGAAALAAILLSLGSVVINRLHRTVRHVKQLGQYTLEEKIGEGAMGKVYRASHAMLRRPTAVKLLEAREPGALERFEREVQLTSQLSHPNTIAIYDFGRTPEGIFYYAMEYLDGIDLADLIRMEGPVPPARVVHLLRQVCGSLAEAHSLGLVHRDIKPSNIMLTVRGGEPDVIKVLDFGLVKRVDQKRDVMLTTMGVVFGTPGFIPPETLLDPQAFDARGDLYAVGAVAYELLTGQALFDRTTVYEITRQHVEVAPTEPSVKLGRPLPIDLENLVMKALAKNPADRPQSALELQRLFVACDTGTWKESDARGWWAMRGKSIEEKRRARRGEVSGEVSGEARTIPIDLGRRTARAAGA